MSCNRDVDCANLGLKCEKTESHLFCSSDNGCACSRPTASSTTLLSTTSTSIKYKWYCTLTIVGMVAIIITIWYFTKPTEFIPSATFCSAKIGYVFKTNNGKTGYYLDS